MKPKKSSLRFAGRSAFLPLTLVLCHAIPNANAAVGTWANSTTAGGNWSDTAKWTGGIIPNAAGDTANFNLDYGTNDKPITIDTTSRTVGILNIGDPGFTYRLVTIQASGGASLIFNNSGAGAQLNKSALANNIIDLISAPVTLADALTIAIGGTASGASGENLRITGVIGETGGARTITKNGTGGLRLGDANTYSGGTNLDAGEIQIGGLTTFAGTVTSLGSGPLTINGGTLSARNGNKTINNAVTVNADFTLNGPNGGTNALTLGGNVNLGSATRTITVAGTGSSGISGEVSNGGIIKAGARPLTLSGANTYTGPTTVTAGTLNLTGSISGSVVTVDSGATFTESATGVIGGSTGFTTSGTSSLAGVNTYTGATTISGGTLTLSNFNSIDFSSGVSVNGAGAKLVVANFGGVLPPVSLTQGEVDGNGHIDSLNVSDAIGNTLSAGAGIDTFLEFGSLTFQGAATLNVQGTSDLETRYFVADELVTSASADVVVNATNTAGVWSSGVDYTVIEFSSYPSVGDASHFTLGTVSGLLGSQTAQLVNTGNAIVLRITSDALIWTGDKTADWSTSPVGTPFNWKTSGGSGVEFTNGNSVKFDDLASQFAVNLATNVSPGSLLVDNSISDYTISSSGNFGILTGSLSKAGSGQLTLTTNNPFTGVTTIFAGTLEISGAGSISSSSAIANSGNLIFDPAVSGTYANPITGSGSVTKQGTGSLTLGGANTFTGDFTLDDGLLNFNSVTALGAGPGTITINGGSLDNTSGADLVATANKAQAWNADLLFAGTNSLDMGSGTVTIGGVGSDFITTVSANTLTIGELKSPSRGLVKQGAGTLVLTSTGATTNGSILGGVLNVSGGSLQINRTDTNDANSGDLTAAGITGSGTITNGAAALRGVLSNPASGTHGFSGTIANGGTGVMVFVKQGAGEQTLSGDNTYTGFTRVEGGTLVLTGSNSMADTTTVAAGFLDVRNSNALGTGNVSVRALGAGVQLQGGITIPNNFITSNDGSGASGYAIANVSGDNAITGTISLTDGAGNTVILSDTGSLTLAGNVTNIHATNTRTLFLQGASTDANTVSGVISNGTPATLVTKRETGTWTLSGINTYTGATTVQDGTLAITGSLGNTPVTVSGGILSLQNTSAISQNVVTFSSTGSLAQSAENAISGTASVVTQKPLTLSMANNYSGDTTINAGTSMPLTITHANAAGTGRLTAATGATTPVFNLHIDGGGMIAMANSFGGNSGVETTIDVNNNGSGTNGAIHLSGVGAYGNGTLNITGGNGYNLSIAGFTNNGGTAGTTLLNPTTANLTLGSYSSTSNSAKILQLGGTSTANSVTGTISNGTAGTVAVTKANTGTWTLSGTNSYTGATAVNAGTLLISGDSSSATGAVTVANGAILGGSGNLGGSVTIQAGGHQAIAVAATAGAQTTRNIGGVLDLTAVGDILDLTAGAAPADGTYVLVTASGGITGHTGGSLDDTFVNFTGVTGTVSVVGNNLVLTVGDAGGYADWALTNAPGQTANQDFDLDGVSNGVEFILGGSATTNDAAKLPQVSTSGGNLVFTFRRDQDSKTPDVAVSIQVGTTLATWPNTYTVGNDTAGSSSGVTVTDNLDGTETITLTVSQAPDAKKFGRLAVTVN